MSTEATRLTTVTPESLRNARAAQALLRGAWDLGIAASNESGRVMLGFAGLGVRAEVVGVATQARGVAVQLSVMTRGEPFPEGWHDQVAGIGADEGEAIDEAVLGWARGPLDLLRDAYASESEYRYELPQERGDGSAVTWAVFEGPLQLTGPVDVRRAVLATCEDAPPFAALVETATLPVFDEGRPHVVRLFAARRHDGTTEAEVRIDAADHAPAADVLRRFTFPDTPALTSLRQYCLLRPLKASRNP